MGIGTIVPLVDFLFDERCIFSGGLKNMDPLVDFFDERGIFSGLWVRWWIFKVVVGEMRGACVLEGKS